MRIGKRTTNMKTLLGEPEMAKHAAAMLLESNLLEQFKAVDMDREMDGLTGQTHPEQRGEAP
jgi:hypothetical protein